MALVGAGVTGLAVARELAEGGAGRVVLVDPEGAGAGASAVAPGGVRQQWGTEVNCRMARESLAFWREASDRLGSPVPLTLRECGYAFVAHSRGALERMGVSVALQRSLGIPSTLLSPAELGALVPALRTDGVAGAAWCPQDGYFDDPRAVVAAFAAAARRAGAELVEREVTAVERDGGGVALRLAGGERLAAGHVVLAAGAASAALLAPLGVDLPLASEARHLLLTDPLAERWLEPLVVSPERAFAAKQLASGRTLASDLSARDPADAPARVAAVAEGLLPRLRELPITRVVEGSYDVTPDRQAILGPVDGLDGVSLAVGFSGHGFMMAPAVARAVAAGVRGEDPGSAAAALGLDRFARGALLPEPQVV